MFLVNLKKRLIVVISLLIVLVSSFILVSVKGSDGQVYIEMYDRDLNHITNIIDVKYEYTRRVYDFDTSNFSGISDVNITDALIFVLCDEYGNYMYSGFVKNLSQDGKLVKFKGEDLRVVFDTEIILDYATENNFSLSPSLLLDLFEDVINGLQNQIGTTPLQMDFIYPAPTDGILWMGNFHYQYLFINARSFLKPYLAYFGYYIDARLDRVNKKIIYEIKKNNADIDIRLDDFTHEYKKTDVGINKTIATLKFDNINTGERQWSYIDQTYYYQIEENNPDMTEQIWQSDIYPEVDPETYPLGFALDIRVSGEPGGHYYINTYVPQIRTSTIPYKEYYLGIDNKIYENTIEPEKMILPLKAKIFEDEWFCKAQFNAINELVNSRYNENIILTNVNCRIDLSTLELNTLINIYDKNNNIKQLPISEIYNNNGLIQIKLGFKKTLLTEIIKNN